MITVYHIEYDHIYVSMDQDWKPVILKRKLTDAEKKSKGTLKQVRSSTGDKNSNNPGRVSIDDDDYPKLKEPSKGYGQTIQKARMAKGLNQKTLAIQCNIAVGVLQSYENDKVAIPGHHQTIIARKLGIVSLKNGGKGKAKSKSKNK